MVKEKTITEEKNPIADLSNTCAIVSVSDDKETSLKGLTFKEYENVEVYEKYNGEVCDIFKNGKKVARMSKELFEKAIKIINLWYDDSKGKKFDILLTENEDEPICVYLNNFGVVIAPRIEE